MEDTIIAQLDKDTLRYEKDPYRDEKVLSIWIKTSSDFTDNYTLTHYFFRLHDRKMLLLDTVKYNGNGRVINKQSSLYNPILWTPILPETDLEKCFVAALDYSQANNVQLQSDYNERYNVKTNDSFFSAIFNILSNNN